MKALQLKYPDGKLEGVFGLFLTLVKDKRKIYDYWDSKRFEIDENNSGDLKLLINRWTVTKKARPTWKVIKLFMNEDLLPDDNLIIQLFPDIFGKDQYLIFRRKIFSAYFITNFFHYLREFELINEASIEMIQNGIRLFYRHFLVTKEPAVSLEEKQNPMFCMLYSFLFTDDMGIDFNKDTRFYFGIQGCINALFGKTLFYQNLDFTTCKIELSTSLEIFSSFFNSSKAFMYFLEKSLNMFERTVYLMFKDSAKREKSSFVTL